MCVYVYLNFEMKKKNNLRDDSLNTNSGSDQLDIEYIIHSSFQ